MDLHCLLHVLLLLVFMGSYLMCTVDKLLHLTTHTLQEGKKNLCTER